MANRLKIGQEVLIHGYVDEIRKDTIIIQNEGGYFGTVECEITDIEMPNTNAVLDKIRDEIKQTADEEQKHDGKWAIGLRYAVKIIDKYTKGEEE